MSLAKMSKLTLMGLRDEQIEVVSYIANVGALQIEKNDNREDSFKEHHEEYLNEKREKLKELHYYSEVREDLKENNLLRHNVDFLPSKDADSVTMATWTQDRSEEELKSYFFSRMNTFALADTDIINTSKELSDEMYKKLREESKSFNVRAEIEPLTDLAENYMHLLDSIIDKAKKITEAKGSGLLEVSGDAYLEAAFKQEEIISQAVEFINIENKIEDRVHKIRDIEENIVSLNSGDYVSSSDELSGVNNPESEEETNRLLEKFNNRITSLKNEIDALEEDLKEPAKRWEDFVVLHDFYEIQISKLSEMKKFSYSDYLFVLDAYVPSALVDEFIEDIELKYNVTCQLREASTDEEDYPVLLQNNSFARPFQSVIEMYSMPRPGFDIDPTALTGIFYAFFFGMMLGDVGYGLVLVIATGIALLKMKGGANSLISMLFFSGIVAIPFGFAFGSFFGNAVSEITNGALNFEPLLFSPLDDPISMMIMSIGFGMVHLFAGVFIDIYVKVKRGNWYQAVFKQLPWFFVILGLVLLVLGQSWGMWVSVAALVVLVLFGGQKKGTNIFMGVISGLGGLTDVTDWLSNALSYTRILALSLSTSVIAMVVNILAMIVGYNGPIQFVIFVVIMIFGHVLNLAISGLSGYVHTLRLQFVEFYGQFYTGGGVEFKPLNYQSKFTRTVEVEDGQDKILNGDFKKLKPAFKQVTEEEL